MVRYRIFPIMLCILFIFKLSALYAQDGPEIFGAGNSGPASPVPLKSEKQLVSLVRFWGDNTEIIAQFGQVLLQSIEQAGQYQPEVVDMDKLPVDVPPGGFPPYICPSPSMTKDAPYALTGEVTLDEGSGLYHLRLYLWEMANVRLIYTDELSAQNREECERYLPSTLDWLFSWLTPAPVSPESAAGPLILLQAPEPEYHRLYVGLKAGSSLRFYFRSKADPFAVNDVAYFFNIIAGPQVSYYFFPFLGVQAEVLFTNDYAPYKAIDKQKSTSGNPALYNAPFKSYSLMFPLVLKLTLRKSILSASALAGGYFILPLGQMSNSALGGNFSYSVNPPVGYTVGINLGTKVGPGNLFLDLRWAQDLGRTQSNSGETAYQRSMVSIAIGYEFGFFRVKK